MHTLIRLTIAAIFLGSSAVPTNAAAPIAEYLYPAGVQQGLTVQVHVGGKFEKWPVSVWTDSTDLVVEPGKEKGTLKVTAGSEMSPGQYWLRLFDASGATRLRPFLVETVAEIDSEAESSKSEFKDGVDLAESKIINGVLSAKNEVDAFSVTLSPGKQLVASLDAHRSLGSPMDTVMQLYDRKNKVILSQVDDAPGRDPRIVFPERLTSEASNGAQISHSGDLSVRLFAFPKTPNQRIGFDGQKNFVYRLSLSMNGFLDFATPLSLSSLQPAGLRVFGWGLEGGSKELHIAPRLIGNQQTAVVSRKRIPGFISIPMVPFQRVYVEQEDCSREKPLVSVLPCGITGHLDRTGDQDGFEFVTQKDMVVQLDVSARRLNFPTDPVLEIWDAAGKRLQKTDDTNGLDCKIQFKPPKTGKYTAVVRDLYGNGGRRHYYRLQLQTAVPNYRLEVVGGEVHSAAIGSEYKLNVKVLRENGFEGDVYVTVAGLPASVQPVTVVSRANEESTKKQVQLVLTSSKVFSSSFQILGTSRDSDRVVRGQTPTVVDGHQTTEFWLTFVAATVQGESN